MSGLNARVALFSCVTALGLVAAATVAAHAEVQAEENLVFEFEDMTDSHPRAQEMIRHMVEGRRKVRAWWGPTFEDTIRVFVGRRYRIQTSLVPGWKGNRGHFLVNTRRVRDAEVTTIHNLIHIYAPNGNRLLAEGLAVYAHHALGGPPARPDYGKDLHRMAVEHADTFDLVAVDIRYRTPRPLPEPQLEAYIVAGSFVGYLIETQGMEKFRALYAETPFTPGQRIDSDPGRWERIYGKPMAQIVADWKAFILMRN